MKFFYIPKQMVNGREYETTFHIDFDIAEHYGMEDVIDTFKRAFKEWKKDIEYVTELGIVMNERCWFWYHHGREELSKYYADRWYEIKDYVYKAKCFKEEDRNYFFKMTD